MLPIHKLFWHEWRARHLPAQRVPEPSEAMDDDEQIRSYVQAYAWGGPTSALQLYHVDQLATLIRPGDTVLDLACGPGPLLMELAPLFPECRFIGADLSPRMLSVLGEVCVERGLHNVETRCEDIRILPSVPARSIDVVITTSALHHLPDEDSLRDVFARVEHVLKPDGAAYVFDFGFLRSPKVRELLVRDIQQRGAPPITAEDYRHSLAAAFPIPVVLEAASQGLKRPYAATSSRLLDFFYFLRTPPRTQARANIADFKRQALSRCGVDVRLEMSLLRTLQQPR